MAYVIAGAILVPAVGWLGNRRESHLLCAQPAGLWITSSLCAFAWSGPSLMTFRALQGLGGGPHPAHDHDVLKPGLSATATWHGHGTLRHGADGRAGIGHSGGRLSDRVPELAHGVFPEHHPGVFCVVLVLLILPNTRETDKQSLDLAGLLALSVFLISILIALSQGQREGWDAPLIQRLFVIAGVAFIAFLACEFLVQEPLVDLRVYTNVTFTAMSVVMLLFFMTFTGSTFLQVILMQQLLDIPRRRQVLPSCPAPWRCRWAFHAPAVWQTSTIVASSCCAPSASLPCRPISSPS